MSFIKCKECGTMIDDTARECPTCGYPIERNVINQNQVTYATNSQVNSSMTPKKQNAMSKINLWAIISIIIGIAIIIMGVDVKERPSGAKSYNPTKSYNVDSATFGADFYTEIYKASDVMVDELDAINVGIAATSKTIKDASDSIYEPMGTLIITLGLGVIAIALCHVKK